VLLNSEEFNVAQIADQLGTYRLKIYDSFRILENLGLVHRVSPNSKEIKLEPPSKILANLQRKKYELDLLTGSLESVLPQLQSQYYTHSKNPIVKVYEGKTQFLNIFHQILEETNKGEKIRMYGENDDFYGVIPFDYFRQTWGKKRVEKGVHVNVIWKEPIPKEVYAIMAFSKEEFRDSRILPKEYGSSGAFWVTPHKIINWNTVLPKAIVIEDEILVKMYQDMFDLIWKSLPKPDEDIIKKLKPLSDRLAY
jgi:sugar-specific transcriptional regulator TrmB